MSSIFLLHWCNSSLPHTFYKKFHLSLDCAPVMCNKYNQKGLVVNVFLEIRVGANKKTYDTYEESLIVSCETKEAIKELASRLNLKFSEKSFYSDFDNANADVDYLYYNDESFVTYDIYQQPWYMTFTVCLNARIEECDNNELKKRLKIYDEIEKALTDFSDKLYYTMKLRNTSYTKLEDNYFTSLRVSSYELKTNSEKGRLSELVENAYKLKTLNLQ